ncbi:hypothetical protein BDW02DRAFT_87045 [Decorospora gaudefroyi]|uniref:Uncharacterized protein n=1 Tax=Decorospora gaudefroyi TaxID=184978 RepID=A0A6A5K8G3_9PLEO|nr:hypothetical protein BDW02DRAFT_87045 [Decorospora gaudefroyi]
MSGGKPPAEEGLFKDASSSTLPRDATEDDIGVDEFESDEGLNEPPDFEIPLEYDESFSEGGRRFEVSTGAGPEAGGIVSKSDLITEKRTSTTYMSGRFSHIEYGTYYKIPACLIIMKFKFHSFRPSSGTRLKYGRIQAFFEIPKAPKELHKSKPEEPEESEYMVSIGSTPVQVLSYAPELVYGELSTETRTWHWDLEEPVGFTFRACDAGISSLAGIVSEIERGHRAIVQGREAGIDSDGVKWTLEESPISSNGVRGIPDIFTVACIVQHDGTPFHGTFRFDGKVGFTLDVSHWFPLTGSAAPYVFAPDRERIAPGRERLGDPVTGAFDKVDISKLTSFSLM